ncbi:DUF1643 domain-containing protein [Alteribacillus sp. JSM 102045]|uniref:DUF1643 domain-containing protein n=1 Tax=Alteribacillus sp. JSM 102045 TaxID=1562101 RepID=UPI0035BEE70A
MEYELADQLNQAFEVEGCFYKVEVNGSIFDCRSQVKINRKHRPKTKGVDAFFILTNPGSCKPEQADYSFPLVKTAREQTAFVAAKSDPTQHQMMRLMNVKSWNQVAIINLSDIRCSNMKDFQNKLAAAADQSFHHHSIFYKTRAEELTQALQTCNGLVIIGWGTNNCVRPLAQQALSTLKRQGIQLKGLKHKISPFYYHPNSQLKKRKIDWLEKIGSLVG